MDSTLYMMRRPCFVLLRTSKRELEDQTKLKTGKASIASRFGQLGGRILRLSKVNFNTKSANLCSKLRFVDLICMLLSARSFQRGTH